jgi:hypothetical protein
MRASRRQAPTSTRMGAGADRQKDYQQCQKATSAARDVLQICGD